MEDIKIQIGSRLRVYRRQLGYSIEELAHKAGIHPGQIGKIERGESNFTISTLNTIVEAMDLSYANLFNLDQELPPVDNPTVKKTISYLNAMSTSDQEYMYQTAVYVADKSQR